MIRMLLFLSAYLFIILIDLNNNEVQTSALTLLFICGISGYIYPFRSWLIALFFGSSIFVGNLIALQTGMHVVDQNIKLFTTVVAFIPAAIGAFTGAAISILTRRQRT